ncbi:MAG: cytidine deaminase [Bacteroidetes bacterium]|nr:MAG: cytidine deaminase [Bacteroidota bacterium]
MTRPSFDDIYMDLAANLSKRSHCVKIKVGAVIAKDTRIVSLGYNGPPAGTHNCDEKWPVEGCPRSSKGSCSLALHAEENAVLYAAKNKVSLEGAALYITLSPCLPCARMIFTTGIKKVYYQKSYAEYKGISNEEGIEFLKRFGVKVMKYEPTVNKVTRPDISRDLPMVDNHPAPKREKSVL